MAESVEDYLAKGEELILAFGADSVDSGGDDSPNWGAQTTEYSFGATDRRLVYLGDDGSFKDIEYRHISSIETESETDEPGGAIVAGVCGGLLLFAGIAGISDDPGMGLLFLIIGVGLLAAAVKLFQEHEETEKQKIKVITGDEADQQLEFTTSENIGAELSRILRENRETQ